MTSEDKPFHTPECVCYKCEQWAMQKVATIIHRSYEEAAIDSANERCGQLNKLIAFANRWHQASSRGLDGLASQTLDEMVEFIETIRP